jgi:hypothetical protein
MMKRSRCRWEADLICLVGLSLLVWLASRGLTGPVDWLLAQYRTVMPPLEAEVLGPETMISRLGGWFAWVLRGLASVYVWLSLALLWQRVCQTARREGVRDA